MEEARDHKFWIEPLARAGYAARGVVYVIVGGLALLAALDAARKQDTRGAVDALFRQPLGDALLIAIIIGLLGFVLWRLVQSILDTDRHGWSATGIGVRLALLVSAGTYLVLAAYALSKFGVLREMMDGDGIGLAERLSMLVGTRPIAGGLALVFAIVAGAHWYKAIWSGYAAHFRASQAEMQLIHPISMIGLTARGIVFAILAALLGYRFFHATTSREPPGLSDAMAFVQGLPLGGLLLALLGTGLGLFGVYSLVEARWRVINVEDAQLDQLE